MICSSCQFSNPSGLDFCGKCGNSLKAICSKCSFQNPVEFSFCGKCGNNLSEDLAQAESTPIPSSEFKNEGERRHLTVMFCDLVGSTALSAELEPEDLRNVVIDYQKMCQKVISRFGGHIAQYLGDGILVYFGYPKATENDANSCVRSALGIIQDLEGLNEQLIGSKGIKIAVRIGIHSGQTVIGDIEDPSGQSQHLAHGKTLNLAARLEGLAEANSIVISEDTFKLVEQEFTVKPKGKHEVKGIEGKIPIYQVEGQISGKIKRRRDLNSENTEPLVGRQKELSELLGLWKEAEQGDTQFAFLCGDAGIGKSKLLNATIERISEYPNVLIIPHLCSPYHKKTAYYTFTQSIKELGLNISDQVSYAELLLRLEAFLGRFEQELDKTLPLFASILGISIAGSKYSPSTLSATAQKNRIDQTFLKLLANAAKDKPVVLAFEDLHYADPATLDVLGLIMQFSTVLPVLGIMTYRPEFIPPWKRRPNQAIIDLSSLDHKEGVELVLRLAKNKEFPQEVVDEIILKTDGVPLFIEELTKMVIGSGALIEKEDRFELQGQLSALAIPSTLQDSLVSRLDKMSDGKHIAQLGATIGRDFSYQLIATVAQMDEEELQSNLNKLVEAEILIQTGLVTEAEYSFRHALIKDAAYSSLLKSQQKSFHQTIAVKLLAHFDQEVKEHPELAAYHYEKAECFQEAAVYWLRAGENAKGDLVSEEALAYLDRALMAIDNLERGQEQRELELKTLMIKAPLCYQRQGYTSKAAYAASKRIYEIASEFNDESGGFMALKNMVLYEIFTGKCVVALEHSNEALQLAIRSKIQTHIIEAYRLIGHSCMFLGTVQESHNAFNKALEEYAKIEGTKDETTEAREIYLFVLVQRAPVLWKLGLVDQSLATLERSRSLQNENSSVHLRSITSFLHSIMYSFVGNVERVLKAVEEVMSLLEKHDTTWFTTDIKTFYGAALTQTGQEERGVELLLEAWKGRSEMNFASGNILHLMIGYSALKSLNKRSELNDYFRSMSKTQEGSDDRYAISELHRIRAEILLHDDPKNNFQKIGDELDIADKIAKDQGALSFLLRNAMSRYNWQKKEEDLKALGSIYDRFTEGFDSKDLKEAKELMKGSNTERT